jgi:hypothetical protein
MIPTSIDRGRVLRLLRIYRWPLAISFVAIVGIVAFTRPEVPDPPPGTLPFLGIWAVFSVPLYAVSVRIIRWIDPPDPGVRVLEAHAGSEEKGIPHVVPREIWEERTVEGPDPYPLDDGAYLVRHLEWLDDIEELRVTGVWKANATALELWRAEKRIDDMHEWYREELQKASALTARVERLGIDMHSSSMVAAAEAIGRGNLPDRDLVGDAIDDAREDVEKMDDPPTMAETLDETDEAAAHAEATAPDQDGKGGAGGAVDPRGNGHPPSDGGESTEANPNAEPE